MNKLIWLTIWALPFLAWPFWASGSCADDLVFHPTRASFVYPSGFSAPATQHLAALQKSANLFGRPQSAVNINDLVLYLHEFSYVEHSLIKQLGSKDGVQIRAGRKLARQMSYLMFDKGVERLSKIKNDDLAPYFAELSVIAGNLFDSRLPDESLIRLLIKLTEVAGWVRDLQEYRTPAVMHLSERLARTEMTPQRLDEFRFWMDDWFPATQKTDHPENRIFSLSFYMCLQILRPDRAPKLNPDYFKLLATYLPRQFKRRKPLDRDLREQTLAFLGRILAEIESQSDLLEPGDVARLKFFESDIFNE